MPNALRSARTLHPPDECRLRVLERGGRRVAAEEMGGMMLKNRQSAIAPRCVHERSLQRLPRALGLV